MSLIITIISFILLQIPHLISTTPFHYDILHSSGDKLKATQLTNSNAFILFQINSQAHYMIISYTNGEIIKDVTLLNPTSPITYQYQANIQTFSDTLVVIADTLKMYLFNYEQNTIVYDKDHSTAETSLPFISLAIDQINSQIIIANCINQVATIQIFDNTFTSKYSVTLTQNIQYFECNVYPTSPNYIICFYLKTGEGKNIYYVICKNDLSILKSEQSSSDVIFETSSNKGFHTFFYGSDKDIAICGLDNNNNNNNNYI